MPEIEERVEVIDMALPRASRASRATDWSHARCQDVPDPAVRASLRGIFEDDGEPLEDDRHGDIARLYLIEPLRTWLARQGRKAFVSGNSAIFYDTYRNPISPDVYVVPEGEQRGQSSWDIFEEGGLCPKFVMELQSRSTKKTDLTRKMEIYATAFRATDYFLYTLQGELLGYHLQPDGRFAPCSPDANGRLRCVFEDLSMGIVDGYPRWFDAQGQLLRTGREEAFIEELRAQEARARADSERARADSERARADEASTQADEARARADEASAQADEARARADEASARADEERRRTQEALAELARLREEIARMRPSD